MPRAYFDHNATTPLGAPALAAMERCLRETYGNASSIHREGQAARQIIETARRQVAAAVQARPDEVVFTGSGTEANNLALFGASRATGKRHIVTTAIEHPAVLHPAAELDATIVPVGASGVVDPADIERALRPDTALVSVMAVNNELGTVQPIAEIAQRLRARGVLFHIDAVQALGKIPLDFAHADFLTLSAHKISGPKGAGALIARKGAPLHKVTFGGRHERDRRPGTENVPALAGFGAACETLIPLAPTLRDHFETKLLATVSDVRINCARSPRAPNTSNILIHGLEGEPLVIGLDLAGFAVSSGAACSSGAVEPSHVLTAIGLSRADARSCLRISLGQSNTLAQVDSLIDALAHTVTRLRKLAPAYA
jgi:cysteine desulfurase